MRLAPQRDGALVLHVTHLTLITLTRTQTQVHLLCQLCPGHPRPPLIDVRPALPALVRLATHSHNEEVLILVLYALDSFLASDDSLGAAVDAGALHVAVALASHADTAVAAAALNAMLKVARDSDAHAQDLVNAGALVALRDALAREDALCMLACDVCIHVVRAASLGPLLHNNVFPVLFHRARNAPSHAVAAHVAYVILHACAGADLGLLFISIRHSLNRYCLRL